MIVKNVKSAKIMASRKFPQVYDRIRQILESARANVARSVNTAQVVANWLIGREIVEEEQRGQRRAGYGEALLRDLSARLTKEYGKGFSLRNVEQFRSFFLNYPQLLGRQKSHALRAISPSLTKPASYEISHAVRAKSQIALPDILHAPGGESWQPGRLHPNLSWTHYRMLLRVDKAEARAFYEIEALKNNWSARELERQKNSLLYERLAMSKDKAGLLRLATKGQHIQKPMDEIGRASCRERV